MTSQRSTDLAWKSISLSKKSTWNVSVVRWIWCRLKKKRYVRRVNLRFCESCESVTQIRDSGFVIHDLVHGDNGNFILIRFVNRVGVLMKFGRPNFQIHSRELRMLL